ncbi:hypothetical protein Ga0609869_003579 [Rhodovulum iodosum]|uniref:Sulfotransferase n=1 Tax=Rhodovulum iodosum TaxID=68291 RepID=A0ABV3XXY7_9RHOB|nr:sulfotransferase [Rhodovulum robiginosum]RSK38878.1 sulfotransferase [Rhodovulum robiginosum]
MTGPETGPGPQGRRMLFVVGLHRSGTTLLSKLLARHSQVSGLQDTGAPMDEGQYLQDVIPRIGGVGALAFRKGFHRTEASPLATPEAARQLWQAWAPHWNLEKPVLLEKSPPYITATRLLQYYFPDAAFVLITRHPFAQAMAISKWSANRPAFQFVTNWLICHEVFAADSRHLKQSMTIRYEDFCAAPEDGLRRICAFAGLPPEDLLDREIRSSNAKYFAQWNDPARLRLGRAQTAAIRLAYGRRLARWGYDTRV